MEITRRTFDKTTGKRIQEYIYVNLEVPDTVPTPMSQVDTYVADDTPRVRRTYFKMPITFTTHYDYSIIEKTSDYIVKETSDGRYVTLKCEFDDCGEEVGETNHDFDTALEGHLQPLTFSPAEIVGLLDL
jgi:hypothetical protein